MGLWERIRERMDALGIKTQGELSAAVKAQGGSLPQPQISAIKNGLVHKPRDVVALARALRTSVEWLLDDENPSRKMQLQRAPHAPVNETQSSPRRLVAAENPLIEWRSADGAERAGEFVVYRGQRAASHKRPQELEDWQDAFAVQMRYSDMSPAYDVGDVLLIQPGAPIKAGKDYLFVRNEDQSLFGAMPRRLVRETHDFWIVKCFGDQPAETRLTRSQWKPWSIFGKYNR
jgi:phage repressor protein C with HTH and peptisase S24 domain